MSAFAVVGVGALRVGAPGGAGRGVRRVLEDGWVGRVAAVAAVSRLCGLQAGQGCRAAVVGEEEAQAESGIAAQRSVPAAEDRVAGNRLREFGGQPAVGGVADDPGQRGQRAALSAEGEPGRAKELGGVDERR